MLRAFPVPATCKPHTPHAHPRRYPLFAALVLLLPMLMPQQQAIAQPLPSVTGRWSGTSTSLTGVSIPSTAIHMAWLRGDEDWESNSTHFHSYLYWWKNHHVLCGNAATVNGALYGWRPDSAQDADCTGNMMASGSPGCH